MRRLSIVGTTRRIPVLVAVIVAAACGGKSPTAPDPTPQPLLTTDPASIIVGRNESRRLHAWFGLPGAQQQEVTSAAIWTSSDPQVVTVAAGVVTAVSVGFASVTAEYQGRRETTRVIARRNTAIQASIRLSDADGRRSIVELSGLVDADVFIGPQPTSLRGTREGTLSFEERIHGGTHDVSVFVDQIRPPNSYVSDVSSRVVIIDSDTRDQLAVIQLPVQRKILSNTDAMAWTVDVPVYPPSEPITAGQRR